MDAITLFVFLAALYLGSIYYSLDRLLLKFNFGPFTTGQFSVVYVAYLSVVTYAISLMVGESAVKALWSAM